MENIEKPAVLVTGASGYIGSRLVGKIAGGCKSVVSMYRQRLPEPLDNVFPVCNDLRSHELLGAPLREIDTVVHLAWESEGEERQQKDSTINLFLLKNLIAKMEEVGTKKLVLISNVGASNNSKMSFLRDKYEIENLAINSNIEKITIVRSPMVMSGVPGEDKYLDAMLALLNFPMVYPVPVPKDKKFWIVSLDEITSLLTQKIFNNSNDPREIVELKSSTEFTVDDVLKFLCQTYIRKQKLGVGAFFGKSLAKVLGKVSRRGRISMAEIEEIGLLSHAQLISNKENLVVSKLRTLQDILNAKPLDNKA